MEKKNKKMLMVFGLLALCVIVTVGLFTFGRNPKGGEIPQSQSEYVITNDVTPRDIEETQENTEEHEITENDITENDITENDITENDITPDVIPQTVAVPPITVRPSAIQSSETIINSERENTVPLTSVPEKPEPPELPETAFKFEPAEEATPEDVALFEATVPAELRNPNVKPNTTPAPVSPATTSPNIQNPQPGDRQRGQG